jgi:hypothetical protein
MFIVNIAESQSERTDRTGNVVLFFSSLLDAFAGIAVTQGFSAGGTSPSALAGRRDRCSKR